MNTSKTTNGGKVTMYSKGDFYYKPASSSKTVINDSFTYTIANKCGQKSTAKVMINYKFTPKNSTGTPSTPVTPSSPGTPDSPGTPPKDGVIEIVNPHEGNMYWIGADGHKYH